MRRAKASHHLSGFAELGVIDPSGLIKGQLNPDVLDIHEGWDAGSVLVVNSFTGIPLNATLYLDYSDPRRSVVRDEVEAAVERASSLISEEFVKSPAPAPEVREETHGEPLPVQLVTRVMVSILLFLRFSCSVTLLWTVLWVRRRGRPGRLFLPCQ